MISITALRPAVNAVIPHLPKAAGVALTRSLPYLPLALELATILYKHREKIGKVAGNLATYTTIGVTGVARAAPSLPKKVGRKVKDCLQYLPLTLEIAKQSLKNNKNLQTLTIHLPNEVKQKIERAFERHHYECCLTLLRNPQRKHS